MIHKACKVNVVQQASGLRDVYLAGTGWKAK